MRNINLTDFSEAPSEARGPYPLENHRIQSVRQLGTSENLPLIELRPEIRIGMRPLFAELFPQLLLHGGEIRPAVQGVRLLGYAYERHLLPSDPVHLHLGHLAQPAAKVIASVRDVKLRINIDHVPHA